GCTSTSKASGRSEASWQAEATLQESIPANDGAHRRVLDRLWTLRASASRNDRYGSELTRAISLQQIVRASDCCRPRGDCRAQLLGGRARLYLLGRHR